LPAAHRVDGPDVLTNDRDFKKAEGNGPIRILLLEDCLKAGGA
jgi:hypothetical protein